MDGRPTRARRLGRGVLFILLHMFIVVPLVSLVYSQTAGRESLVAAVVFGSIGLLLAYSYYSNVRRGIIGPHSWGPVGSWRRYAAYLTFLFLFYTGVFIAWMALTPLPTNEQERMPFWVLLTMFWIIFGIWTCVLALAFREVRRTRRPGGSPDPGDKWYDGQG